MQNVLGIYPKYENYHGNSGNSIKSHGGDPASFSFALRTGMPMKQSLPEGHFDSSRQEHLFKAKGWLHREQPAHLVAHPQLCSHIWTESCESVSLSRRAQLTCAGSLKCWFNGRICCEEKVCAQRLKLLIFILLRQVAPVLTPKTAPTWPYPSVPIRR